MYFRIVSGSSSVSDRGLGKKLVENESKLSIRLLSERFLCRLHLSYYLGFCPSNLPLYLAQSGQI